MVMAVPPEYFVEVSWVSEGKGEGHWPDARKAALRMPPVGWVWRSKVLQVS